MDKLNITNYFKHNMRKSEVKQSSTPLSLPSYAPSYTTRKVNLMDDFKSPYDISSESDIESVDKFELASAVAFINYIQHLEFPEGKCTVADISLFLQDSQMSLREILDDSLDMYDLYMYYVHTLSLEILKFEKATGDIKKVIKKYSKILDEVFHEPTIS